MTAEPLTGRGAALGTVAYMSPEQARAKDLDNRTDLFSFGAVLYEMATGQQPFRGESEATIYDAILNHDPVPPAQLNRGVPVKLEEIIQKALEKDRELRYQHAADIRTDLQRMKRENESGRAAAITAAREGMAARGRWTKRAKVIVPVVLIAALLAVGVYYRLHHAKPLTDKDTIVLADFANSTGDPVFDDTLKTALSVALNQSPFLNVLPENKIAATLKLMTKPPETRLTPEVTRELCQRAGSKAYIAGSIGSLGSEYVLALKALNCQSGDPLAEEQVTAASKERVLDALGEAASKLRGELGESLATVQKFDVPLAHATTSSLEALKAFTLGNKASNEEGSVAALPYHQKAIELDPKFAVGYAALGVDYFSLAEPGRATEYLTKAFQLREQVSEPEKLQIAVSYYSFVSGELDKAAQACQEGIETYPRNAVSYGSLGMVLAAQGQYERAVEIEKQSIRRFPDTLGVYGNLANHALALRQFDQVQQVIREGQSRRSNDFTLHLILYGLAFLEGDSAAMAEQQRWFVGKPEEHFALAFASDTEAYAGHLGKARELTKQAMSYAMRADSKESGAIWRAVGAQREAAYGYPAEARHTAAEALSLVPTSQGVKVEAALALALAGDSAGAESLAHDLNERYPLDTQVQSLWLPAIQAQLALDRKDPSSALSVLEAATSPLELGQISFVVNISCLYPTYIRGETYLAAGQGRQAAAEFQKILDHSGIVWNCWTGALAHLGVGRANALQSRTLQGADADAARVRALAAYEDFLTLWKDADRDIPVLKQAKSEYLNLQ